MIAFKKSIKIISHTCLILKCITYLHAIPSDDLKIKISFVGNNPCVNNYKILLPIIHSG